MCRPWTVWGPAYIDARQMLRAHIANLRHKIELTAGDRLIHTDHGVGYRLADLPARRPVLDPPYRQVS
jgi:DNA-binding response OmpR family regulator